MFPANGMGDFRRNRRQTTRNDASDGMGLSNLIKIRSMEAKEIVAYIYSIPFIAFGIYVLLLIIKGIWVLIRDIFDF